METIAVVIEFRLIAIYAERNGYLGFTLSIYYIRDKIHVALNSLDSLSLVVIVPFNRSTS